MIVAAWINNIYTYWEIVYPDTYSVCNDWIHPIAF